MAKARDSKVGARQAHHHVQHVALHCTALLQAGSGWRQVGGTVMASCYVRRRRRVGLLCAEPQTKFASLPLHARHATPSLLASY
jgi:hypothetical protein